MILEQMICWAKLWSWWQVTAYITQELRESVRFLERIYTYDELRLHLMILGQIASVQKFIGYDFAKIRNLSKSISLQTAYIPRIFSTRKPLLSFESYQQRSHPNGCFSSQSFPRKPDSKRWFSPWHGCKNRFWHALRNPNKPDRKAWQHCC